ncbi:hypothetical protein PWT90_10498 [Aphanocladium album]|nr:hypothetical protein PWT90_10498 [Aphanocladium album]
MLAAPSLPTTANEPSRAPMGFDDATAMFASPPKPTADQPSIAPTPPTPVSVEPRTPSAKRAISDDNQDSTKRGRVPPSSSSTIAVSPTGDALRSFSSSASSQDTPDEPASDTATTSTVNAPAPGSITALTSDLPRPHRSRHPPKRYPVAD